MSAMARKRRLAVKASSVAMGQNRPSAIEHAGLSPLTVVAVRQTRGYTADNCCLLFRWSWLMAHHQISLRASRRKFITIIGGAAVSWPCAVPAQQTAKRVIGFLDFASSGANNLEAFRAGLRETGFVEGRNLAIEYRF